MKIYTFTMPTFNTSKAVLVAEELGLNYELVKLDPKKGEHKAPEHMARHPLGKIPVLEHGDVTLFESMSIVRYLLSLAPHDLAGDDWAVTDQWSDYFICHPGRQVGVFFWEEIVRGRMNGLTPDADALAAASEQLTRELAPLESRLASLPWISGQTYGVADAVAACYALALEDLSFDVDALPGLSGWYARVSRRPAFIRLRAHYS